MSNSTRDKKETDIYINLTLKNTVIVKANKEVHVTDGFKVPLEELFIVNGQNDDELQGNASVPDKVGKENPRIMKTRIGEVLLSSLFDVYYYEDELIMDNDSEVEANLDLLILNYDPKYTIGSDVETGVNLIKL